MNDILFSLKTLQTGLSKLANIYEQMNLYNKSKAKRINYNPIEIKVPVFPVIESTSSSDSSFDEEAIITENLPKSTERKFNFISKELSTNLLSRADRTKKRIEPYEKYIQEQSAKYNVPAEVIKSIIVQESSGFVNAKSPAGAIGIMQIMPGTGKYYGVTNSKELYDPLTNISVGVKYIDYIRRYLGYTYKDYSDPEKLKYILASYNAGHERVKKIGDRVFNIEETRNYVNNIMQLLNFYRW